MCSEHQFPEEETPEGVRLLLPCLLCGLPAADAIAAAQAEIEQWKIDFAATVASRDAEIERLRAEAVSPRSWS